MFSHFSDQKLLFVSRKFDFFVFPQRITKIEDEIRLRSRQTISTMSRDIFHGDDGPLVKKEIIDSLKDSFFSAEEKVPEIAEVTVCDVVGQQQQTTIEQLLLHQAEELEIELTEINLDDPQEQRELFACFDIETNLSKKTKLRKLIRELQSKPSAAGKKLQSGK